MTAMLAVIAMMSGCQRGADPPPGRGTSAAMTEAAGDLTRVVGELVRDARPADLHGIVVVRDGGRIAEAYAAGTTAETLHDIRSATKSVTSLLVGIAIDRGLIRSVDDPLGHYLPGFATPQSQIRIRDLLTMRSGLAADDGDPKSPGHEDRLDEAGDWLAFARGLPMAAPPGTVYRYASVNAFLAGAIVERAAGMPLDDFARIHLFQPLGIQRFAWRRGPAGHTSGQGNLKLSARSAAELGRLMLDGGRGVVSARWIADSLAPHVAIGAVDPDAESYGFLWYTTALDVAGRTVRVQFASGNGGNKIYLVPESRLVVAITSSAYDRRYGQTRSKAILHRILVTLACTENPPCG